jgi:hypothetical protein
MARGIHPNSLANLKKGKTIQEQPNANHGRYPLMQNAIKTIPQDAQEKVYSVLWTALTMSNVKEAQKYIEEQAAELPECGMILQICLRALLSKSGFITLMDICDRLFGKPKQSMHMEGGINLTPPAVIIEGGDEDDD